MKIITAVRISLVAFAVLGTGTQSAPADEMQEVFAWFDGLGFPSLARCKLVHVTPEETFADLNRFVDAVRPESMPVRNLEQSARRLGQADLARLRGTLHAWADNDAVLAPASGRRNLFYFHVREAPNVSHTPLTHEQDETRFTRYGHSHRGCRSAPRHEPGR